MDPNGSFPKNDGSSRKEAYLSPLHEALRGTTAVQGLGEYVGHNSSTTPPIISGPQETTILPSHNYSSYNPNMALAPPPFQLPHQQNFLTTPMGTYFDSSEQAHIMSTESPPVTSLLQGDPFAVVHAHLNTTGVLDNGPIFENSATSLLVPEVNSMPSVYPFPLQNIQPFISGTISQQQRLQSGSSSHVESFGPPYVPREQPEPIGGTKSVQVPAGRSGVVNERVYTCRHCPNATFSTPQAYGGHMSAHSKKDKKNMSSGPSSRG
uniref:C2H2-type domain-containing protein n=1 Tax=Oryza barthii TaxID=65489 RepID=A0A0D3ENZ8_9ORYZ